MADGAEAVTLARENIFLELQPKSIFMNPQKIPPQLKQVYSCGGRCH